jgi:hypothetical protein
LTSVMKPLRSKRLGSGSFVRVLTTSSARDQPNSNPIGIITPVEYDAAKA